MRQVIGMLGAKGSGKDTCAAYLVEEAGFVRVAFADTLYSEVADAYGVTVKFLGNRDTKETRLPQLALIGCENRDFVDVAISLQTRTRSLRQAARRFQRDGTPTAHVSRRRTKVLVKAPRSPRWTMQLWGTEYRRKSKYGFDSYWLDQVRAILEANPTMRFVITDVRFKNEAVFVATLGGQLVRVTRPVLEAREAAERAAKGTAAHPSETELIGYPVDRDLLNEEGQLEALRVAILSVAEPAELKKAA